MIAFISFDQAKLWTPEFLYILTSDWRIVSLEHKQRPTVQVSLWNSRILRAALIADSVTWTLLFLHNRHHQTNKTHRDSNRNERGEGGARLEVVARMLHLLSDRQASHQILLWKYLMALHQQGNVVTEDEDVATGVDVVDDSPKIGRLTGGLLAAS